VGKEYGISSMSEPLKDRDDVLQDEGALTDSRPILLSGNDVTGTGSPTGTAHRIGSPRGPRPIRRSAGFACPLRPEHHEVLQNLANGFNLDQIAVTMRVPRYIVWTYAEHLLRALDASTYTEAIATARRRHWIT